MDSMYGVKVENRFALIFSEDDGENNENLIEQIVTKPDKKTKGAASSAVGSTQKGAKTAVGASKNQVLSTDQKSAKTSGGSVSPAKKTVGFQGAEKATTQQGAPRPAASGGPRVNNRDNNQNQDQQRLGNDQRGPNRGNDGFGRKFDGPPRSQDNSNNEAGGQGAPDRGLGPDGQPSFGRNFGGRGGGGGRGGYDRGPRPPRQERPPGGAGPFDERPRRDGPGPGQRGGYGGGYGRRDQGADGGFSGQQEEGHSGGHQRGGYGGRRYDGPPRDIQPRPEGEASSEKPEVGAASEAGEPESGRISGQGGEHFDRDAGRGYGRGGYRGGFRGGYREGGGGYRDDTRGKREFDRRSGTDKTGVKATEKKEGGGGHNWGQHAEKDFVYGQDSEQQQKEEDGQEGGEQRRGGRVNRGERNDRGERDRERDPEAERERREANEKAAEEEKKKMTLEEFKKQEKEAISKPQYNIRKPGEGEDASWKRNATILHEAKKSDLSTDTHQQENEEKDLPDDKGEDSKLKSDILSRLSFAAVNKPREYAPRGDDDGGRRGDRDREPRGGGRGGPRGGYDGGNRGGERGNYHRGGGRGGANSTAAAPSIEDPHDFPALGGSGKSGAARATTKE